MKHLLFLLCLLSCMSSSAITTGTQDVIHMRAMCDVCGTVTESVVTNTTSGDNSEQLNAPKQYIDCGSATRDASSGGTIWDGWRFRASPTERWERTVVLRRVVATFEWTDDFRLAPQPYTVTLKEEVLSDTTKRWRKKDEWEESP